MFLAGLSYLAFALFGLVGAYAFMSVQTADAQIVSYGASYLQICCILSFGLFFQIVFERLLQSIGRTLYTMCTQMLGAVINIILDPIMIFGLFGFPRMEVAGAALATVLGQIIASVIALLVNLFKTKRSTCPSAGIPRPVKLSRKSMSWGCPPSLWPPSARP